MHPNPLRVDSPPTRPLLVWDGDCRFCGMWARRWNAMTGDAVDYESYQTVGDRFPEIKAADYAREIYLFLPDGQVFRGAAAVFQTLSLGTSHGWGLWMYQKIPGFAPISEFFYRRVANNRFTLSWLTRIFWGDPGTPSTFRFSSMLFLRLLGLVFLVAFISFWGQAEGLVGDHGIIPVKDFYGAMDHAPKFQPADQPYLNELAMRGYDFSAPKVIAGMDRFRLAPSLLWLSPNSAGLAKIMGAGVVCSLFLMAGLLPAWALLGCVLLYQSLRSGVPVFLGFQWDILLVESGVVALLIAPWGWWQRPWSAREPPRAGRWSVWWLLFKLMVLSGLVKLLWNSGAPGPEHPNQFRYFMAWITGVPVGNNTWLDGTALQFHYFTQPIPASTSWWFHHLPAGIQSASLWFCMVVELIVPFAFFAPRRLRHSAALLQIFLQVMLLVSGNYGFFNLLTIVLCLPLFDDTFWPARVQRFLERGRPPPPAPAPSPVKRFFRRSGAMMRATVAGFIFLIGLVQFTQEWNSGSRPRPEKPRPPNILERAADQMYQLGLVSRYGLFRVMTTERPEIILEGSDDGKTWKPYDFVWKPGDPMRQPSFTTPHMPRLDWQMWFAALSIYYEHQIPPWLTPFALQLKAGNPDVLALLDNNPFPKAPPKLLRLELYLYQFTTAEEQKKTGAWWTRTLVGQAIVGG